MQSNRFTIATRWEATDANPELELKITLELQLWEQFASWSPSWLTSHRSLPSTSRMRSPKLMSLISFDQVEPSAACSSCVRSILSWLRFISLIWRAMSTIQVNALTMSSWPSSLLSWLLTMFYNTTFNVELATCHIFLVAYTDKCISLESHSRIRL